MQMRHKPSGTLMAFMANKQKMAYTKDTNGMHTNLAHPHFGYIPYDQWSAKDYSIKYT